MKIKCLLTVFFCCRILLSQNYTIRNTSQITPLEHVSLVNPVQYSSGMNFLNNPSFIFGTNEFKGIYELSQYSKNETGSFSNENLESLFLKSPSIYGLSVGLYVIENNSKLSTNSGEGYPAFAQDIYSFTIAYEYNLRSDFIESICVGTNFQRISYNLFSLSQTYNWNMDIGGIVNFKTANWKRVTAGLVFKEINKSDIDFPGATDLPSSTRHLILSGAFELNFMPIDFYLETIPFSDGRNGFRNESLFGYSIRKSPQNKKSANIKFEVGYDLFQFLRAEINYNPSVATSYGINVGTGNLFQHVKIGALTVYQYVPKDNITTESTFKSYFLLSYKI